MLELIAEARAAGTMPTKEERWSLSDVRKRFGETAELVAQQQDRRTLDELSAGQRPRWTLVDAPWTPKPAAAANRDNESIG